MSYVYKNGFGRDVRFPVVPNTAPIVQETIVAPARSQYEVSPTLLRPTIEATPEPLPQPIAPMVDPRLVTVDPWAFPNSGWAPVAPSGMQEIVPSYVSSGPAPVVSAALTVEPVDSVAQSVRSVTEFPLDSQMAASDASLTQQLLSRGMPSGGETATSPDYPSGGETMLYPPGYPSGGEAATAPLPYTTPLTDSKFTDPYRDPSRFMDASERPDMDPDYTSIPYVAPIPPPERTAYVQDNGLTALPMEDVIAPQYSKEVAPLPFFKQLPTFHVPRAPDAVETPVSQSIPEVADTSSNYQQDAGTDLPDAPETKTISPSEAAAACTAKGGNYVYDAASGQNVCLSAVPVAAPASGTPWLLIGAVGLAALFLLKK